MQICVRLYPRNYLNLFVLHVDDDTHQNIYCLMLCDKMFLTLKTIHLKKSACNGSVFHIKQFLKRHIVDDSFMH